MEGSIELEYQGQFITIERSTVSARAPMGQFRAYDTKTGQPISWLTGETCGQTLLGVERSVFERGGFLRQTGLSLSKDASLERRLGPWSPLERKASPTSKPSRPLRGR